MAAADEPRELAPPVFAEDLAPNVRAGFDSTCDFIRRSHAALTEQIAQLATRIDALGDAPARAQPQDVVHRRPTDQQNRHQVGYTADGELDYDAPKQHPFVARPAGALRGQPHGRDQVGHVVRVQHDDGGFGHIKLSIPPFSGHRGPEDYLEWEMRMDQIFASYHYSEERRLQLAAIEFTGYVLIW